MNAALRFLMRRPPRTGWTLFALALLAVLMPASLVLYSTLDIQAMDTQWATHHTPGTDRVLTTGHHLTWQATFLHLPITTAMARHRHHHRPCRQRATPLHTVNLTRVTAHIHHIHLLALHLILPQQLPRPQPVERGTGQELL